MGSNSDSEASSESRERWKRVDNVLQSALELDPIQRAAFLAEACGNDETLLREVKSLLASHTEAGSFLETPITVDAPVRNLTGRRIGPYEIQSHLGAGGMGEVYRATDTRLNRTVAIKFLPAHLSHHSELRQRLEREARAVSSLNHPNICTLYDFGRDGEISFLVMEYLDGETLADRLGRGALPLDQALKCAIEIADALSVAHRQGVTHRDVKPGNIMLVKSGSKLLDFGLAKVSTIGTSGVATSVTKPSSDPKTAKGTIVGTMQYMAPEQLEGAAVDARTDIFAFGAVLYEMVTGRKAFEGKSTPSLIAAIMASAPPPISELQSLAPSSLDHLIRGCLAKDPEDRWQNVNDVKRQLQWIAAAAFESDKAPASRLASRKARTAMFGLAIAALVVGVGVGAALFATRNESRSADTAYFAVEPPEGITLAAPTYGGSAISPDGARIVYAATRNGETLLYVRSLNSLQSQPLAGTEDGHHPFWSPDSRSVGFFAGGKLKTVSIAGGMPVTLCNVSDPKDNQGKGGTWNKTNDIIFATARGGPLYRVSALSGNPEEITTLDKASEESHRWPYFLPDGKHFIYFSRYVRSTEGAIYVGSLESKDRTLLFEHSSNAVYAQPGYLLFAKDENLMARRFDATNLKLDEESIRVAGPVATASTLSRAFFSVSEDQKLVLYGSNELLSVAQVVRFDRSGKQMENIGPVTEYRELRLSPDGQKIAYSRFQRSGPQTEKLWLLDLTSGVQTSFSADMTIPAATSPVWSADGSQVFYGARPAVGERFNVYRVSSRSAEKPELLLKSDTLTFRPLDISRDGRFLLIGEPTGKADLWFATLGPETKLEKLLVTPFREREGRFSPDGLWVAYTSDESGNDEVYIRAFPSGGNKIRISTAGGRTPVWRRDGSEVAYLSTDSTLMSVTLKTNGDSLKPLTKALFKIPNPGIPEDRSFPWWEMTGDGQFFYVIVNPALPPITVILNWTGELNSKN